MTDENEPPVQHFLMWVGGSFYPTADDFIWEAMEQGVSKKIGKLPDDLAIGRSRVYLAWNPGFRDGGSIIGYFVPSRMEVVVDAADMMEATMRFGNCFAAVPRAQAQAEPPRGCGKRRYMGAYLVTDPMAWDELQAGAKERFIQSSSIEVFTPFARTDRTRFLGIAKVTEDEIAGWHSQARE